MKLTGHFDYFLRETVNLNQTRLEALSKSVEAVYGALKADPTLGPTILSKIPQGSWAHRTIIKPLPDKEFDADFLLEFEEVAAWSDHPKRYLRELDATIGRNGTYQNMPREKKCRCVRLSYKGDFHVDIVPYLTLADGREVIVNGDKDEWEPTNPDGFTAWIGQKDEITGKNLRKVIRILKFLRDHKGTFEGTRSIILTTIVGERVEDWRTAVDPTYYADVPTTLLHVVADVDDWLQANPTKPSIADPSRSGANFDHRWNDSTYGTLRNRIHEYSAKIREAYDEPDQATSVKKWQALFGDGFTSPPSGSGGGRFGVVPPVPTRSGRAG